MTERFGLFFRWFANRYFRHFALDDPVVEQLAALEARGSVVYVMRYSSRLDYFLFNTLFLRHGLRLSGFANAIRFYYFRPFLQALPIALRMPRGRPREVEHAEDREIVREQVAAGRSLFLFLRTQRLRTFLRRRKRGQRSDELDLIGEVVRSVAEGATGREVFVVPLAIFWRKGPRIENRFLNVDYGSLTRPSDFAKVARFLSTYRSLSVKVGEPVDVGRVVRESPEQGWERLARRIRRATLIYLYREEKVVEGPSLKPRWRVLREVLRDPGVRRAMAVRAGAERGSPETAEAEVEKIFREISANMSSTWLAVGAAVVGGLFRRLFASIEVHRLAEVTEDARRNPIVLVPSHRSYFDFLILSWLFYQNYLVPPHIAARENMAFGPFGYLFRHMGAFFLRRSFDDPLYKEVFRAYVGYLVREGFTQEFFIEGGRSRTGKTLAPRLGMLRWDVEAFLESRRRDLFFVPIAISYERLVEESGMVEELGGGAKKDESMLGLIRARKYLKRRFGSVHVSFGEPISLASSLGSLRPRLEALQRGEVDSDPVAAELEQRKREFVSQLGHSLVERIGWAMVANATSVAAAVLLGGRSAGLVRDDLVAGMRQIAGLLKLQGVRLTPAFERDLAGELRDSIAFLERSDLIQSRLDPRGEILHFEESRRRALDIYRNGVAHYLVIPSILARAVRAGLPAARLQSELELWMDMLYREYYASRELVLSRGEAVLEHFESEGWVVCEDGLWIDTPQGEHALERLAEQTRGVIECYDTLVRVLRPWMESAADGVLRSGLLREAHLAFESAALLGEIRRPEAVADTTFDNAIAWLESRSVISCETVSTGKRGGRDTRYARGEKWAELAGIEALLAAALRDG
ncbi:MAG: 1-acyl-sn-glycerol-3-phosphate acyltransferase [Spirochaetaceae bacterium]|nr:1-acyl-sn-glycerol-3-phosphate acyltransferase [Myxococcales bacterium]MCB9724527.1 1-acyl-sn-glycerol-3-phosphate acyltransferase [Spirochaetaceae bacterium]